MPEEAAVGVPEIRQLSTPLILEYRGNSCHSSPQAVYLLLSWKGKKLWFLCKPKTWDWNFPLLKLILILVQFRQQN